MPLPTPKDGESKDDFVSRCMGNDVMNSDFPDAKRRRAVCERQWDKGRKGALNYPHIVAYVLNTPWAITQEMLTTIVELVSFYASGGAFSIAEVEERIGPVERRTRVSQKIEVHGESAEDVVGQIAVLPLFGTITHRMGSMSEISGGTSAERFSKDFQALVNDPEISGIILDVDSPGGNVSGIAELAAEIYEARGKKPVVAVANSTAASAAYWLATSADELVVTPTGEVGNIGVLAVHKDLSASLEKDGVKINLISAGKYKVEGNPYEPLGEEARRALQARVDEAYDMFVRDVARNRGVSEREVRTGFGEGRLVGASKAVTLGMADRVATLDETIIRMQDAVLREERASSPKTTGRKALKEDDVDWKDLTLEELQANRPDLLEAAASEAVSKIEALQAQVAELSANTPLEPIVDKENLEATLADANFQLALARAAHVGLSKTLYESFASKITSLEQLEAEAPRLRLEAMNAYLKQPLVVGTPTGRMPADADPADSPRQPKPDPESDVPDYIVEARRYSRKARPAPKA